MDAAAQAAPPRAAKEAETTGLPPALPPDYFAQILPAPPVICGLPLKPLSIGRYRRMKRQNVAFVSEQPIQTPITALAGDLLQGVLICSMSCADYDAFLASPDFERVTKKWAQLQGFLPERYHGWGLLGRWFAKYIVGEKVTRLRNERAMAYLVEQIAAFQEYIVAGQKAPSYWDETSDERVSGSHWSQSVECVLREKQGWTREEIDEEPLTKALWDFFKSMEAAGMVRIMSAAEAAELARPLTAAEEEESRVALEKLWRYKFGDTPMPTG